MPGAAESGPPWHLVLAVGPDAATAAAAGSGDGDRVHVLRDAADAAAVLDAELARLTTGWRIVAIGTTPDAAAVRAAALARGALSEEVTVRALDDGSRVRVHCGVCHHHTDARRRQRLRCPGCGTTLEVTDHDSPVHGAVLGAPRP